MTIGVVNSSVGLIVKNSGVSPFRLTFVSSTGFSPLRSQPLELASTSIYGNGRKINGLPT
jgi:hypothetical protein